ncbi:MAG: hypothetical protein ABIG89_06650 [Candidatus Woesearchaeota archaeon]
MPYQTDKLNRRKFLNQVFGGLGAVVVASQLPACGTTGYKSPKNRREVIERERLFDEGKIPYEQMSPREKAIYDEMHGQRIYDDSIKHSVTNPEPDSLEHLYGLRYSHSDYVQTKSVSDNGISRSVEALVSETTYSKDDGTIVELHRNINYTVDGKTVKFEEKTEFSDGLEIRTTITGDEGNFLIKYHRDDNNRILYRERFIDRDKDGKYERKETLRE